MRTNCLYTQTVFEPVLDSLSGACQPLLSSPPAELQPCGAGARAFTNWSHAQSERLHWCAFGEPACTWFGCRYLRRRQPEQNSLAIRVTLTANETKIEGSSEAKNPPYTATESEIAITYIKFCYFTKLIYKRMVRLSSFCDQTVAISLFTCSCSDIFWEPGFQSSKQSWNVAKETCEL